MWALDSTQAFYVLREDVHIQADTSAFFSKDSTAIRAILRADFAFSNPAGIIELVGDLSAAEG